MSGYFKQAEKFQALARSKRNLVFYSEGSSDWLHLSGMVTSLIEKEKRPIIYLSSDKTDPGLNIDSPLMMSFLIGLGGVRANVFSNMEADVLVMTTPDLQNLELKRSSRCRNYVYVFHSPVSTHMIYQPGAFDHFDTIFCVGPHHEQELLKRHAIIGKSAQKLVPHGYGRLDDILASKKECDVQTEADQFHVVVAPSWGSQGIFETIGQELVQKLLECGFKVTARPHPQTVQKAKGALDLLRSSFQDHPLFSLETDMSSKRSLLESDLMISDWSGAAFDYAFGLQKPVLFIDTPRKVNNPDYMAFQIEPIEVFIRQTLGRVIAIEELGNLDEIIKDMMANRVKIMAGVKSARKKWIYHVGQSADIGAKELIRLANTHTMNIKDYTCELLSSLGEDGAVDISAQVPAMLLKFGQRDYSFCASDLEQLEKLCRKIDIAKKVLCAYDAAFKKPTDKRPLPHDAYPALITVYIKAAENIHGEDLGLALKFLNTAGNALNQFCPQGKDSTATELESLIFKVYEKTGVLQ